MPIEVQFFAHKNSYTLQILSLEKLSVAQIQSLEYFTQQRRGIFDFEKSRISIQKRLEKEEVEKLLKLLGFDVVFVDGKKSEIQKSSTEKKTSTLVSIPSKIPFGKYKGTLYGDLPLHYLQWLSKNYSGPESQNIMQELANRS